MIRTCQIVIPDDGYLYNLYGMVINATSFGNEPAGGIISTPQLPLTPAGAPVSGGAEISIWPDPVSYLKLNLLPGDASGNSFQLFDSAGLVGGANSGTLIDIDDPFEVYDTVNSITLQSLALSTGDSSAVLVVTINSK